MSEHAPRGRSVKDDPRDYRLVILAAILAALVLGLVLVAGGVHINGPVNVQVSAGR
jgi:hypothetical protein